MQKWLARVGRFRVEHVPLPYWHGNVDLSAPRKGILHTTEGSTIEGALSAYRAKQFTPTFTLGRDAKGRVRILQHKPLGIMGSTLANPYGGVDTNRLAVVQIELVGFSQRDPWYPEREVADALTSLMAALHWEAKIPLVWKPCRRSAACWLSTAGWMGHIDVPENSHWDPGQLDTARLLREVEAKTRTAHEAKRRPRVSDKVRTIPLKRRAKKARPTHCHLHIGVAGSGGRRTTTPALSCGWKTRRFGCSGRAGS